MLDLPVEERLFKELGYVSRSFITNTIGLLKGLIYIIITHLLCLPILLLKPYQKRFKFLKRLYSRAWIFFHYKGYIRYMLEAFFFLMIFSLKELQSSPNIQT